MNICVVDECMLYIYICIREINWFKIIEVFRFCLFS